MAIGYGGITEIWLPPGGSAGQVLTKASNSNYDFTWGAGGDSGAGTSDLVANFDGGGALLPSGDSRAYYECHTNGTILGWALTGSPVGSLVVDVWTRAGAIPTGADSITGGNSPALVSSGSSGSTVLTGWSTTVSVGDIFGFSLSGASSITLSALTLTIRRGYSNP